MAAFGIGFLVVLGFGCLTGLFGLFLVTQYVSQKKWGDWPQQQSWITVWATGCAAVIAGWLLRSAAGGRGGTWPQWNMIGTLLLCLSPALWPIAVFILRPHRTKLERLATQHEEPKEGTWPPPPNGANV